ncbi:alanine racemase [Gilvimarinus agarilyticus]|uniref:alanine racemase n=1 Tax=unclassified Gilvimarinus TaxID=2642066 RepID=UPI001C07EFF7|nr:MULTISPECIES: alanine racemase [unclassified Gilvimarinus]MBU2884559.1 alanine racemase [Gilvimarinus agarilyticus]MDO6569684.1 alanine racemase [Gilvimarinus sp. 2_MG-2023]MDO6748629.1 alanine racemase [Gilvimarinus sp. 1_MG-2023]
MSEYSPGLTIDLTAVVDNWCALARVCAPAVTSAVVKADAYGLGVGRVSEALFAAGCRHFFVATLDEAQELFSCVGSDISCYVLGGAPSGRELECARINAMPVLSSLSAIRRWREALAQEGVSWAPCGLKFDTGMSRQGVSLSQLDELLQERHLLQGLNPQLIMSHLACADEPVHPLNKTQLDEFKSRAPKLRAMLPDCKLSLANSCGIFLGADYHLDLVRPGAALYGYQPPTALRGTIADVVTLSLPVLQIKRLEIDSAVGYGATITKAKGSILAICAGGYADGLHNIMQSKGCGAWHGQEVPVVGRISMDATIFDLSAVPGIETCLDSVSLPAVEVINKDLSFSRLTQERGLLGYELLTSLRGGRYKRHYQEVK